MKTQNNTTEQVLINKSTLSAIKQMLFGKTGTNLATIVEDVTLGDNDDLAAINVALAFQGFKPEVDKTPRFKAGWKGYSKYEVIKSSLITGLLRVKVTYFKYDKDADAFTYSEEGEQVITPEAFDNLYLNEEKVQQSSKG
jgi:hypothetical protein